MRAVILATLLLTACYEKSDAIEQLKQLNRPDPIRCVIMSSDKSGANESFACTDGENVAWLCDSTGCIRWVR